MDTFWRIRIFMGTMYIPFYLFKSAQKKTFLRIHYECIPKDFDN